MKIGETVKLAATAIACQRTKNRLRENGLDFVIRSAAQTCQFDRNGQLWICFESVAHRASDGKGGKEAWHGWLPVAEIEVREKGYDSEEEDGGNTKWYNCAHCDAGYMDQECTRGENEE